MLYLLGGCPLLGKTTAARKVSFACHIPMVEADDICSIAGKTSDRFSLFRSMTYYDYFTEKPIEQILADAKMYQDGIEPVILSFLEEKAASGDHIIEGLCIMPHMVDELGPDVRSLFLTGSDALIEAQYKSLKDFGVKSKNKPRFDANYLRRLKWYNDCIREETLAYSMPRVELDRMRADLCQILLDAWGLKTKPEP